MKAIGIYIDILHSRFSRIVWLAAVANLTAYSASAAVVAWGNNGLGQTIVPDSTSNTIAVAAGGGHNLAIKADGTVVGWGFNAYGQSAAPAGLPTPISVAAGYDHSAALGAGGIVTAWGRSDGGQTAVPAGLSGVAAISVNQHYSVALKSDGTVVAWGANDFGQLNIPAGLSNVIAVSAGGTYVLALKNDRTVVGWGSNSSGQSTPPAGLNNVIAIAAGGEHGIALKNDGTIVAWGNNGFGQATVPAGLNNVIAIASGHAHSMVLKADGTVLAWGWNDSGQATVPAGLTGVSAIAAGYYHSVALIATDRPPTIDCPDNVILQCTNCYTDPEYTGFATGTDDGPVRITHSDSVEGDCPKVVTRTWLATDAGGKTASCVQTITCVPASLLSLVTDSSGCTFDRDPSTPVQDFRLLFTPDTQNIACYKLTASNPGQFYYNVFHTGTPGQEATFNITIPYPFVTKGANPVHAYDWVTVLWNGDEQCLIPGNTFAVDSQQITLSSYGNPAQPSATLNLTVRVPDSGTVFLNVHLDFGLKKTGGYTKNSAADAVDCATGTQVIVPNRDSYGFSVTGAQSDTATIQNINIFKKNPGVAGQVSTALADEPVSGSKLKLLNAKGQLLLSATADQDGFYQLIYKHTGKEATFYVSLVTPGGYRQTRTISLRANKLVQVDFRTP